MAETHEDITLNDDAISLREWIAGHVGHVDNGIHDLQQAVTRMEKMIIEMHEELQAAKPLIEKWQHSKINQLIAGRLPWQQP